MSTTENTSPQWLKNLQENSWQMELFISGGAIFSLFQAEDFLLAWAFTARMTVFLAGTGFGVILSMLGIKLLTVGFFTHLLLRAYWISLLCLNDVFPSGSNIHKLKIGLPFFKKTESEGNLINQIIRIDQHAGLVFFFSIISTLIISGSLILIFIFLSVPSGIFDNEINPITQLYFKAIFILLSIYYLDLIIFGFLRKLKGLSYLFFPIFWLFDRVTLRFLYEKPLQVYGSNIHRGRAVLVFLLFFTISIALSYSALQEHMGYSNLFDSRSNLFSMANESLQVHQKHYKDELTTHEKKAAGPVIQSMKVRDNYLEVFIPYKGTYDYYVKDNASIKIADLIGLVLDSDTMYNIKWYNYHAFENDQVGMIGMIDVKNLERGEHQLIVFKKKGRYQIEDLQMERKIIFWKE
jgi:hypothetical protein